MAKKADYLRQLYRKLGGRTKWMENENIKESIVHKFLASME